MKAPRASNPRRPAGGSRRVPRTGAEAAVELVRVEFERARHLRELDQLRLRAAASVRRLDALDDRARALCSRIAERGDGEEDS
jgi:hypothetical protein